ncbi:helix-turn-helix domain-containing protein [Paremcibacter congregatus]|uniref:Transcriptional regulator n=1 Tax=Paremcibacter congregatus TaxID=2043170 RepID=A0A2G4YWG3_9PROT|nr:helix-turn-helix transcriptional regulator [Paremcibacter congregatus]PHZ86659.1 transcriptional regulator [Paremcibacter congregatus]QDE26460.1 helix-turn-helix transcriptional regulator [Paremcibacter congregatus]
MIRKSLNPIDVHVGSRIFLMRKIRKLTQSKLGHELNVTFQQIQKYEQGKNRVSASRLYQLSQILKTPITFFFDDFPPELQVAQDYQHRQAEMTDENRMLNRPETMEFVKYYYEIRDKDIRNKLLRMIKVLGEA